MPSLKEIKEQIKNLDRGSKLFGRREINELPNILWDDENVEKIIQGIYKNRNGILVATHRRLVFVKKGITSLHVEDFSYADINSIQYETGFMMGKITIFSHGTKA